MISTGMVESFEGDNPDPMATVAMSPDGLVIAIGHADSVYCYVPQIDIPTIFKCWTLPSRELHKICSSAKIAPISRLCLKY
jgi:hypothetical protein